MKNISFRTRILFIFLLAAFSFQCGGLEEGRDFLSVVPPVPKESDRSTLIYFFSYDCKHCYEFEPVIKEWVQSKGGKVELIMIPAQISRSKILYAKVFFTAQALGVINKFHADIYDRIHKRNERMYNKENYIGLFKSYGINKEDFFKRFSFII
ncbi:MAG: hypothetical protein OEZ34_12260 [Spirochaetia bacterium]|nr:hypothetical protein [Spirochaetia bacterium]